MGAPSAADRPALQIDLSSPVPPYEQLRGQLSGLIAIGELPSGTRLPSIRQLAADLGLASGTVARAYSELEAARLIESRGRHGTFVIDGASIAAERPVDQQGLARAVEALAFAARRSGASDDVVLAAVRSALARLR